MQHEARLHILDPPKEVASATAPLVEGSVFEKSGLGFLDRLFEQRRQRV